MKPTSAILTVDVELWTWRGDYELDVRAPVELLLGLAAERQVPITFFMSLSNKGLGSDSPREYLAKARELVARIVQSDWADVAVHTHCCGVPVGFPTPHDELSAYGADACEELLAWNVEEIAKAAGRAPCAHRAANYSLPTFGPPDFYELLSQVGLAVDSSDISVPFSGPRNVGAIVEMPPATTAHLGARHKVWSPDTMSAEEMLELAGLGQVESDVLVMNCHSFMLGAPELRLPRRLLFKTWFGLPPLVQKALRPPIRVLKSVSRSVRPAAPAQTPYVAGRLTQVIDTLTEQGWDFTDFRSIVDDARTS